MITLPSNLVWVTDTLGVAIVPGDPVRSLIAGNPLQPTVTHGTPGAVKSVSTGGKTVSSAFVAPQEWAQYDKPGSWWCEECHASWLEGDQCWKCGNRTKYPVGRQVWELRTECDCACHRLKSKYPGISHDVLGQCRRDGTCDEGSVPLGRFTLQVVPVVDYDTWAIEYMATGSSQPDCIVVHDGVAILVGPDGRGQIALSLDPLPTPGRDFALVVRKVGADLTSDHSNPKGPT